MMQSSRHVNLSQYNSFAFPAMCPRFYQPKTLDELKWAIAQQTGDFYILGEGSNTLFTDKITTNIIQPVLKGIQVTELDTSYQLSVMCGENWHDFVSFCVESGYDGLENLALIPGSVGAAPVQNVGAYGVELSSIVKEVKWLEFQTNEVHLLNNKECEFHYRDSIFKNKLAGLGCIIEVTFELLKDWTPNIHYAGLDTLPKNCVSQDIFKKVIEIRQAKLPNPKELPNAGSFFKNPIVSQEHYHKLQCKYADMPSYLQPDGQYKLAAGWLIEQAGLKGYEENGVGVHKNQALVLVNYHSAEGITIINLAKKVQQTVLDKFNVELIPEVRLLSSRGLLLLEQCK